MKTEIFLIRHAKSIANEKRIFGGITDYELSQEGLEQAKELALELKNYKIDKIYSSPLKRAVETIKPTAIMKNEQIIIVDDLKEMYVGTWENVLHEDLWKKYPKEKKYMTETGFFTGMDGQEEVIDVANRMYKAILKIAKDNINKTVVITSHFAAIRAFLCKILDIPFEKTEEKIGYIKNASIIKIIYDDKTEKFEVVSLDT